MVVWITADLAVFVHVLVLSWLVAGDACQGLPAALFYQYSFDPREYLKVSRSPRRVSRECTGLNFGRKALQRWRAFLVSWPSGRSQAQVFMIH